MKIITGDFGDNVNATLCRAAGWLGGPLESVGISSWFAYKNVAAAEIEDVQAIADDSKTTTKTKSNVPGAIGGIALGAALGGPVGAAIGGLLGSGGKLNETTTRTEKLVAVLVRLTDGRLFLASCDLKEFGLLSAAASKNKAKGAEEKAKEPQRAADLDDLGLLLSAKSKRKANAIENRADEQPITVTPISPSGTEQAPITVTPVPEWKAKENERKGEAKPAGVELAKPVLAILQKYESEAGVHLWPDIPPEKLANATATAAVPAKEIVLGLIDCTLPPSPEGQLFGGLFGKTFGNASDCLLFGSEGFYYHHSIGSNPNPGKVPYAWFPKLDFTTYWIWCIRLGKDHYCRAQGARISRDKIITILDAIRKAVIHQGF